MRITLAMLAFLTVTGPGQAAAQAVDYALRTTAVLQADGKRDLGLAGGKSNDHLSLTLAPRILIELDPAWTGYVRSRIFVPTGHVAPFNSSETDSTRPAGTFAGVDELWIQFNGFTSYPGEGLRIGRQRIRQTDSEWWDQDADAVRWLLDTTLLHVELGVAREFSTYRSDGAAVPAAQRGRTYLFGDFATDWRAENRAGLRWVHANDTTGLPQTGSQAGPDAKLQDARLTWVGAYFDNGFYSILGSDMRLSYAGEINFLTGKQSTALRGPGGTVGAHLSQDVESWEASAGLRWRPLSRAPLQFGGGYTYSKGGGTPGRSQQYQQTGMQSNASYFTGTDTLMGRYNETLQAQLGNLLVATGFVSLNLPANDASLVFEKFRRDSGRAPIVTDNVIVAPENDSQDVGAGVDFVLTHYFTRVTRRQRLLDRGDAFTAQQRRSLISLRASVFEPGDAYGSSARTDYRALLEVTLWVD